MFRFTRAQRRLCCRAYFSRQTDLAEDGHVTRDGPVAQARRDGCDNGKIGTYAKLVDDRNESAHPNGNIFYSTREALDAKITEILRVVEEIQTHSKPVIEHCYLEFLLQNHDPEEREYPEATDQIREVLIHGNYMSRRDVEICLGFDVERLRDREAVEEIRTLHETLAREYNADLSNASA